MNQNHRSGYVSVKDIFGNPNAYLHTEVIVQDFAVAQSRLKPYKDLCWMLSEEWLDASSDSANAIMDRSKAIQLCLALLSADFWEVAACGGGWAVDAWSVIQAHGTLEEGTNGFAYNLVTLKSVLVRGRNIINASRAEGS